MFVNYCQICSAVVCIYIIDSIVYNIHQNYRGNCGKFLFFFLWRVRSIEEAKALQYSTCIWPYVVFNGLAKSARLALRRMKGRSSQNNRSLNE